MTRLGTYVRRNFEPLLLSVQVLLDVVVLALAMLCAWWLVEDRVTALAAFMSQHFPGAQLLQIRQRGRTHSQPAVR